MSDDLTCPKCAGSMRSYERNGVHVDQCGDCRGIFLDRGELERLVDAEAVHYSAAPRREDDRDRGRDRDRDDRRHDAEHGGRDDRSRGDTYRGKKKSRTSFLSDLLEMGG